MRNLIGLKFVVSFLVAAVALTGCAAGTKQTNVASSGPQSTKPAKPPLQIPQSFADETAKLEFASKAVSDRYYAEAKPLLEQLTESAPNEKAYALLGTTRYNVSDYAGAIAAWSKVAELNPKLAGEMQNNIGNALRDSRKPAEAEAAYRQALKLEPTRWTAAINLASMLQLNGKLPQAISVLEGALAANAQIDPLVSLLNSYRDELKNRPQ